MLRLNIKSRRKNIRWKENEKKKCAKGDEKQKTEKHLGMEQ